MKDNELALGKHKMKPLISPHKTWEGSIGATVTSLLLVILAAQIVQRYTQITNLFSRFYNLNSKK